MLCPNCGQENPATTGSCTRCGQSLGSLAAAPAVPRPPAKPMGTRRNLGLMPLWFILTVNIYWLFWLYKTYKEVRAHTPGATDVTPGKAVGFMFIPFFNLYWFFRIMTDMPRAIRRMQEDDPLGEPPLDTGLVTGLLTTGILGNTLLGFIYPGLILLSEPLVIVGFVIAQATLNAHWERHAAGAVPSPRAAATQAPAAPRPAAFAKPAGTRRTLGLMPLWFILTVNLYWLFWLYKTYKEVRAHTPSATDITPGKAVGFLFIPLFNIYWFFRIMTNLPRAIRRMQEDDPLGEPPLNTGLVTGLLIAGMLGNGVMGQIHPALMLLTEPLIIIGFVIAQATLNAHWERHAAGAVPGQRVAQPLAAAAAAPRELARLLGVRAPQVEWGAGAAFLVATVLADLVFLLLVPLLRHETVLPLYSSMMSLTADLLLTVAAVAYFHWIRNDAGAAALAAIGYSLLQVVSSLVMAEILLGEHSLPAAQSVLRLAYSFLANFLFLLYLALAVRFVRPVWLGLWLGATAAQLASSVVYRVVGTFLSMRLRGQSSSLFHIDPWDVATDLLFAAVFAFAFWGGLSLMAPRVLQQR